MASPNFARARDYIFSSARLLERHLFSFHFEAGPTKPTEQALTAYQHENGLYGYGLEPDKRTSDPQPIDQAIAMELLDTVRAAPSKFLSICNALPELTNPDGGLPFSHPTVETAPHAPWWSCKEPQPSSINPTAVILSYLWRNGISHEWMKHAEGFCWDALNKLDATRPHSIQNALFFLAAHPDTQRTERPLREFRELVRQVTCFDPNAQDYVFSPLRFATSPNGPASSFFTKDELQLHLEALINQQQDDGGWPINWPAISPGVLSECRGIVTLRNLKLLRDYGRLEVSGEKTKAHLLGH
ncbi:hypothetical protein SAMN04488518_108133 [Pseudovibrio ascidiaceicola]|uniref:Uncharacterized protein n=1 Tax=Pseudovibrio ascidiaceicola TaxID=285279 RepID=A0A1I4BUA3_9HYPH|nr:hypothetical protein [Pseudovibrio ascidiaceicola]SFK71767.1 hypothetical protein SAMN04488518_108133 [Pseudovibrio ascidiaceicola]